MFRLHTSAIVVALAGGALSVALSAGARRQPPTLEASSRVWVQRVLDLWTTVARDQLQLAPTPLSWIAFYDHAHAWHVDAEVRLLPTTHLAAGSITDGSGRQHSLHVVPHSEGLWLPGTSPLALDERHPPSFTVPSAGGATALAVVPLPSEIRRASAGATTTDPEALVAGIAVHELTHTRQLPGLVRRIARLRERHPLPSGASENLVQQTFATDEKYVKLYRQERDALFQAASELDTSPESALHLLSRALTLADQRRQVYFHGERAVYAELEDIFLVLEGVGVWAQFQAGRLQAPTERWQTTAMNLMHLNTDWVQEEGFALFVVMDRLVPDWQPAFFDPDFPSPFEVLAEALRRRQAAVPPGP